MSDDPNTSPVVALAEALRYASEARDAANSAATWIVKAGEMQRKYMAERLRAYMASEHCDCMAPCCGGQLDDLLRLVESGEIDVVNPRRSAP
jgi:hypothetical protein